MRRHAIIVVCVVLCVVNAPAQDSLQLSTGMIKNYTEAISTKASRLQQKIVSRSEKELEKLEHLETKMMQRLRRMDSTKAARIFGDIKSRYDNLKLPDVPGQYVPKLDTLFTSLNFINKQSIVGAKEKIDKALDQLKGLKEQLKKAESIKQFLKERKKQLHEQLGKLGFAKELKRLNKQAFYYAQQLKEYKEILKDSKKAERKALELLSKTKFFRDFMKKNSQFASLFGMPADDPASFNIEGLQTRAMVNNIISAQVSGSAATSEFRRNMQSAQAQLQQLQIKAMKFGRHSSDDIMPEGFRPNTQKTKTFMQRIEYGANLQTLKSNGIFPVTSDIALQVGYKLNDKSIIGIASSFRMGWGTGFRNIRISSQGIGLRSFVDYKLKGSFWISGGYEMNYRSEINQWDELRDYSAWQQSGIIGIGKIVNIKSKFLKQTKVQILWDIFSYRQVPAAPALLFRIGYIFK